MSPRERIERVLEGVAAERLKHPPVAGCDDSLAHRTATGWTGASSKCILFHAKGKFYLVVTTAEREIKARRFKKPFGTKDIRFATPEEVTAQTGCTVGSLPPFGVPEAIPIFVDGRIFDAANFMFNPADPELSVKIATADLRRVLKSLPNPVTVFSPQPDGDGFLFERV